MGQPVEIPDAEYEQVHQRVAAIDVGKAAGVVCVRMPSAGGSGRRVSKVWQVDAKFNAVVGLAERFVRLQVEKVTVTLTPAA
jgi:hypothetical protein